MHRLLPLIALLLPAPALADITARYTSKDAVFTVEIDDGGNARAGIDGKFVLIRRDGVDYVVLFGRDGRPHVARADAALAKFGEKSSPPRGWQTELTAEGDATVAGYPGSVWRFGPAGDPAPLELVMSPDPTLAPIGEVFRRAASAFAQVIDKHGGENSDAAEGVRSLFSHGTPVRIREKREDRELIALQSVSRAGIDSHRFDLPGPVSTPEEFFAAIAPPPPDPNAPPIMIENPAPPKP
jgi:hypothetical protein